MMKSYKELMSEGKVDPNFIKNFLKDISPFLKEIGGLKNIDKYVLFRGIKKVKDPIITVRKNRRPLDTGKVMHKMLDDWFFDAFKHKHRSSSVFAIGNNRVAEGYGKVVAIFPIGKFSIAWSDDVPDLTSSISDSSAIFLSKIVPKEYRDSIGSVTLLSLEEMGEAIEDGVEKFVKRHFSTKALAVWKKLKPSKKKDFWEDVIFNIEEEVIEQMNQWKYTDKDFVKAIGSGHEIQIATNKYYVMSDSVMTSPFNQLKDNNPNADLFNMLANLKKHK